MVGEQSTCTGWLRLHAASSRGPGAQQPGHLECHKLRRVHPRDKSIKQDQDPERTNLRFLPSRSRDRSLLRNCGAPGAGPDLRIAACMHDEGPLGFGVIQEPLRVFVDDCHSAGELGSARLKLTCADILPCLSTATGCSLCWCLGTRPKGAQLCDNGSFAGWLAEALC